MPSCCRDPARAGFSLVEVLLALAIIGLALGAAASVFGNGLLGHATARDVDTALALADEKLAEAGVTERLQPGQAQGVFAGRFLWHLIVTPYDDKAVAGPTAPPLHLFRVEARIAWRDGVRERQIALATLRMAPAPP